MVSRLVLGLGAAVGFFASAATAQAQVTLFADQPAANSTKVQPFIISGWALDTRAPSGTGIDVVAAFGVKQPETGAPAVLLGQVTAFDLRSDVGAAYGAQFAQSGYSLIVAGWPTGTYRIVLYAHSTVTGEWAPLERFVTFQANPAMWIDTPTHLAAVTQPLAIQGWAIDRAASSNTGVDHVHVWAYPNPGSGQPAVFWGPATLGGSRPDVAAAFGPQFQNSAYTFTVTGTTAGIYHVVVYSHSMLSNTWTSQAITLYIDMPTAGLVIDRQGSGTGAITGTNVSVSCVGGATTQGVPCVVTAPPALNATVTLTPAADSGSVFQGWSGACSGTSTCQVTMAGPQYVSARFGKLTTTVTTNYYHTDVVGSIRALTSSAGAVVTRHDYAPFGEDPAPLAGDPKRFAGKDLDVESALQNFEARMYRNIWGRFLTVDPVGGSLIDPQRWNAYAYAGNNPLKYGDPTGLAYSVCIESRCSDFTDADWQNQMNNAGDRFRITGGVIEYKEGDTWRFVGTYNWYAGNPDAEIDDQDFWNWLSGDNGGGGDAPVNPLPPPVAAGTGGGPAPPRLPAAGQPSGRSQVGRFEQMAPDRRWALDQVGAGQ